MTLAEAITEPRRKCLNCNRDLTAADHVDLCRICFAKIFPVIITKPFAWFQKFAFKVKPMNPVPPEETAGAVPQFTPTRRRRKKVPQ